MERFKFQQVRTEVAALKDALDAILQQDGKTARGALAQQHSALLQQRLGAVQLDSRTLRLAVAGEYSVGKSSIIRALTGAEVDVAAGSTTQVVTTYLWEGIELVDMPGTLSGQFHNDKLAIEAVAEAGLVLFVVTNELFNEHTLPFFRRAATQLAKKNQMLLVVNKFDRFHLGDRTEEEGIAFITPTLAGQIAPLSIEPFGPVVVSAKDFIRAVDEVEPNKRQQWIDDSRINSLVTAINRFTAESGMLGESARPAQQLIAIIHEAKAGALSPGNYMFRAEAYLRRRKFALRESRSFARTRLANLRDQVRARVVACAQPVVAAIEEGRDPEDVAVVWASVNERVEDVVREAGDEIRELVDELEQDIEERFAEVNTSPLAEKLRRDLGAQLQPVEFGKPPEKIPDAVRQGILRALKGGAKVMAKNPAEVAQALSTIYGFFGGTFKPWRKARLGKLIGRAGKVLGPLLVVAEGYMKFRQELRRDANERIARELSWQVRDQFSDAAQQFDELLSVAGRRVVDAIYNLRLAELQEHTEQLFTENDEAASFAAALEAIEVDCLRLIDELVSQK
ncbi:50S ribosome-binding GTPase [Desulfobulbus sp. AH-315-M07]|nr:50S ribosome-binding GTPase [Desulfobulbus sp. AH-315-M07]